MNFFSCVSSALTAIIDCALFFYFILTPFLFVFHLVLTKHNNPVTINKPKEQIKSALPSTIRGLRAYIRENNLQSVVKKHLGKSVSNASKAELIEALQAA